MPRRLAHKLILSLTVIVVIVEGIAGYINVRTQERQLLDAMILGADQLSKSVTSATWQAMLADNRSAAYDVMQTIAMKQGIERISIFNRTGQVMYSTRQHGPEQVSKSAEECSMCHSNLEPLVKVEPASRARIVGERGGARQLILVTPIYNEPACAQAACHAHPADLKVLGVLDLALDLSTVDREVRDIQIRNLTVTGIQIVLIALFIYFFTRHFVSKPIGKLVEGTRAVSAMQLDNPIEINTSEELGELSRSFNVMRVRLMQAMDELNQFAQGLESKVEERTQQLKVAHRKLLQTDRLASLGQLSASVAHEINNPLSGVLNLSMLMQRILKDDGIPPGRIPEFRKYLSQVILETSRVGRIVSDLLSFSRQSKLQRAPADLNSIVRNTVSLVSHKLELSNVRVDLQLQEPLPRIRCEQSQIQQVVMNLLMNGAEATHARGGGMVCVMTRPFSGDTQVTLQVTDNGEGIPPENLVKIFDPFFTTKPEGKGVGLGLAVVYGIIESHGGDIDVKSKVGEGTTFTVTLPVTGTAPPDAEARKT
ncbi:MAG: integral rane sensor signal transduction histidine kinase [Bacteroidetes bacterium]|nr:integral rane sensor signal transduction histidine kinase [Bacteroidota bacterium]